MVRPEEVADVNQMEPCSELSATRFRNHGEPSPLGIASEKSFFEADKKMRALSNQQSLFQISLECSVTA